MVSRVPLIMIRISLGRVGFLFIRFLRVMRSRRFMFLFGFILCLLISIMSMILRLSVVRLFVSLRLIILSFRLV